MFYSSTSNFPCLIKGIKNTGMSAPVTTDVMMLFTKRNGIVTAVNLGLYPTIKESSHNAIVFKSVTAIHETATVITHKTGCCLKSFCLNINPTMMPSTTHGKIHKGVVGVSPYSEISWQMNSPTPPKSAPYQGPKHTEIKTIGKPFNENLIEGGKSTNEA